MTSIIMFACLLALPEVFPTFVTGAWGDELERPKFQIHALADREANFRNLLVVLLLQSEILTFRTLSIIANESRPFSSQHPPPLRW